MNILLPPQSLPRLYFVSLWTCITRRQMLPASWLSVRFTWSFHIDAQLLPPAQHEFIHSGYSESFTIMITLFSYLCVFIFSLCDVYSMYMLNCVHMVYRYECVVVGRYHECTPVHKYSETKGGYWCFPLPLCFGTALLTDLKAYSLVRLTWQWFAHLYVPILGPQAHRVRHYFIHGCLEFEYIFMLAKKPLLTTEASSPVLMVCLIIYVSKHTSFWISITKTPQFQVKHYNYYKICLFMVTFTCAVILTTGNYKLLINQDTWCNFQNA